MEYIYVERVISALLVEYDHIYVQRVISALLQMEYICPAGHFGASSGIYMSSASFRRVKWNIYVQFVLCLLIFIVE